MFIPPSSTRCRVWVTFAALGAVASTLASSPDLRAATYYWDSNGTTSGIGSVVSPSNWLSNSWATTSTGTAATAAWPNTQPNTDEAFFMGTAGIVNIGSNVYANKLTFQTLAQSPNYEIASIGGVLNLSGINPTITVTLPNSSNDTATISAPIAGTNGLTLAGNSDSGGLKFLVLANASAATPNTFTGTFTINLGGALRLGGGALREQIPDDVDMNIAGVIDFITVGGASDMKQEKVRNVAVTGAAAIFSVGNGSDFIVNSITGTNATNISVNGNNATVPGKLTINGWSDGSGDLTLNSSLLKLNTTSNQNSIGGRAILSGDITSTGLSEIINNNGGGANTAEWDDNLFTHKAFDFASPAHTINVADGTLSFKSRAPSHPLQVTSLDPGGTTLTKTGTGVLLYEHAVQTSFSGTNRVEEGTLRIGANERLANNAALEIAGGAFDLQGFSETVGGVLLDGGTISGSATGVLVGASNFDVRSGTIEAKLSGSVALVKNSTGFVQLSGANNYTGITTISAGTLLVNGTHIGGGVYAVQANGTLGGSGTINAAATILGTLAPGNSVGTLTLGDTQFTNSSVLEIEVTGSQTDRLIAQSLVIDNGALLEVSTIATFDYGTYTIADYASRSGEFQFSAPAGFSLSYDDLAGQMLLHVSIPGDFNLDGFVNGVDLAQWQDDYGVNGHSDGDGDGDSDGRDFLVWQRNFGASPPLAEIQAVPEPDCIALIIGFVISLSSFPRRCGLCRR